MKKFFLLAIAYLVFSSHDMFLKMGTYFLQPNTPSTLKVFNGTFEKSENAIATKRMADVSLVGNGQRTRPDSNQWSFIDSTISVLNFKTGEAGTWVAGLSSRQNQIALSAKDFNEYLEHDGVLDMLKWRKANNALGKDAVEKYSKHVKAIFQVGDKKTDDWKTLLGYPIELVPESNPYDLEVGKILSVKLLRNGQPLANQLVYVGSDGGAHGHAHTHDHAEGHSHTAPQLRTDANGIVQVKIENEGIWYLRTIQLVLSEEKGLTHESNWSTLTFEVKTGGGSHTHGDGSTHKHSDGSTHAEHGFPIWGYALLGAAVLLGLFYFLRRRK